MRIRKKQQMLVANKPSDLASDRKKDATQEKGSQQGQTNCGFCEKKITQKNVL